ncbi:hypothetical protein D3C74_453530 [compost metagenome]
MVDAGLPAVEHIVCFLRISRILAVQRGIPAPIRETRVISRRRTGSVLVVPLRVIVGSGNAVHGQIVNFLVVLQQINQHQGTFSVL